MAAQYAFPFCIIGRIEAVIGYDEDIAAAKEDEEPDMTVEELLANPAPAETRETQQWELNTEWEVLDRLARALANQSYASCNERGA